MSSETQPVSLSLVVRFFLEVGGLVALAYWGWTTGGSLPVRVVLAVGAPLAAAVVWGLFVAPKATRRLSGPWRLLVELLVFGAATAALVLSGREAYALAYAVAVVVDEAVLAFTSQW